jgi:hypothetical protein
MKGFGWSSRETGQSLEPAPPQRMVGIRQRRECTAGDSEFITETLETNTTPDLN